MKVYQKISGLIEISLIILISVVDVSSIKAQNLILNPGCEDTLDNSEIPHWTEILGSNWTQRGANPDPFAGNFYFFAGVASEAELQQDVDVSNYESLIDNNELGFNFEGFVRTFTQSPADQSRIKLEFLDFLKTTKLDTFDSGNYSNTSAWIQVADTTIAPQGTRYIRVRLISTRRAGSNNDGYYDSLSLTTFTPTYIDKKERLALITPILFQNYPNPFNPKTEINFQLKKQDIVKLVIYDILGREIITLVDSIKPVGKHSVEWDATNYPSGLYFYMIQTALYVDSKKMLLIR